MIKYIYIYIYENKNKIHDIFYINIKKNKKK